MPSYLEHGPLKKKNSFQPKNRLMYKNRLLMTMAGLMACTLLQAAPRTEAQMRAAAAAALNRTRPAGMARVSGSQLRAVEKTSEYHVYAIQTGGFAIVATDDLLPDVLGYSAKTYRQQSDNPHFSWWLQCVEEVSRQTRKANKPLRVIAPDTTKYAASVPTMLRSEWGQTEPYWNQCPVTTDTCVVGCVATAMSQILYYHRAPVHGSGSHSLWLDGQTYTADFGSATYDYDHMLDFYAAIPYTQEQADAVAQLCYHCGIAVDMQYSPEGSGAYSQDAADALDRYFGFSNAKYIDRYGYSEKEWMDILFEQFNNGWPVYYSGSDPNPVDGGGHAFVLDGYDEKGLVSVNWGWNGCENGYYNIALLNPFTNSFYQQQGAVINIKGNGPHGDLLTAEVQLEEAGTLAAALDADRLFDYGQLTVSGPINSSDLRLLRELCGRNALGESTRGNLEVLDLRNAQIVAGGEYYLEDGGRRFTTAKNVLPERAFFNCRTLRQLYLPESMKKMEKGALALCNRLDTVYIPTGPDKAYVMEDGALYDKADPTLLLCVPPTMRGTFEVKSGTTVLADYAIAGCLRLHHLVLPSSLTYIGHYAFYQSNSMMSIRCYSREPVNTGGNLFTGIRSSVCYLNVPAGSADAYRYHSEWSYFSRHYDHITEFGSAVMARNAGRDYGEENPTFGYQFSGDRPNGIPVLTCEATASSPVGEYVIHVEPGTITDEIVTFVDGTLKVWKAKLKVSVGDYERYVGQENPEFELTYDGFKLGETPDVLITVPVATTTATVDSPEGEYPITISGGEAQNYDFRYTKGTLKVVANPSGVSELTSSGKAQNRRVYTLDGRSVSRQSGQLPKGVYVMGGKKYVVK